MYFYLTFHSYLCAFCDGAQIYLFTPPSTQKVDVAQRGLGSVFTFLSSFCPASERGGGQGDLQQ